MTVQRSILVLVIVCAAILSAGLTGCAQKKKPALDVAPSPSASADVAISKAKTDYTDALKKAKDWQKNATLARVYRQFKGTLSPEKPTLTFGFASLADPKQSYEVTFIGEDDVKDSKAAKKPFELAFTPVDVSQWTVDPDSALQMAEKSGGQQFREQHLAGYTVLQQLAQAAGHPLQWYFRYDTGDGSNKRYEIYVNAQTGAVDLKREVSR
jgi:hypothetical protein